ncbi:hypothetical protein OTU49_001806, partial [Cherax quadricarinatus]
RRNLRDKSNIRSKREKVKESAGLRSSNGKMNVEAQEPIENLPKITEESHLSGHTLITSVSEDSKHMSLSEAREDSHLSKEANYPRELSGETESKSCEAYRHRTTSTWGTTDVHRRIKYDSGGSKDFGDIELKHNRGSKEERAKQERANSVSVARKSHPGGGYPRAIRDLELHSDGQSLSTLNFHSETKISYSKRKSRNYKLISQFSQLLNINTTPVLRRITSDIKSRKITAFVAMDKEAADITVSGDNKKNNFLDKQTSAFPANVLEPTIKSRTGSKTTQAENSDHMSSPAARFGNRMTRRTPQAYRLPRQAGVPSSSRRISEPAGEGPFRTRSEEHTKGTATSATTGRYELSSYNYKVRTEKSAKEEPSRGWKMSSSAVQESSRGRRTSRSAEENYELGNFSSDSGCDDAANGNKTEATGRRLDGSSLQGVAGSRVHVAETVVTVLVKDINDNPPVFPNATMFGEVQENGPIDLSVAVVAAWDADDITEGTNARITYSIAKNVVYEPTGEAIFSVDPDTGLIRTAICCLDRETTPEYEIQVVAVDGGGLKGTGVVVIRLVDVNDNSPRLERSLWEVETEETWGSEPPHNSTILHISVIDTDTSNYFFYRVVEASGWGWEHFSIRTVGSEGHIFATQTLDYEDETHRRGFKFMVQVTDKGRGGWRDARHMDAAWVTVLLKDVNDNPPQFHRPHAHVTVREDAHPGTLLAALPAHDPDMGGEGVVDYHLEGAWGALSVDSEGAVTLRRGLDREAPDGAIGVARIVGVDRGRPPLTATATLTITVTDVNDSPPVLLPPTLFHVTEGAAPTLLGALTATDHDVWALGHGPPFNLSLAPTNPAHVLAHIALKFDPHLDSGRGGAEVWTVGAVDREEHRQLLVGVLVADAGGVAATHTVTVIVDDINDNPMKPGAKTVYLWKTQGGGSEAPLGRVFVDDPDDWDLPDKSFHWRGAPHPLFSLNTHTGDLFASSQVKAGRYDLQFSVDDLLWGQKDVEANVTVAVRVLTPDALAHAAPIILTPTTPAHLTQGWTPQQGGGGLGRVVEGVLMAVGGEAPHTVEVVSVYAHSDRPHPHYAHTQHPSHPSGFSSASSRPLPHATHVWSAHWRSASGQVAASTTTSACVWVSVKEAAGTFMDPVKLQGLLALHSAQ